MFKMPQGCTTVAMIPGMKEGKPKSKKKKLFQQNRRKNSERDIRETEV